MSKSLTLPAAPVPVQDSHDQDDLHIVEYLNQDNIKKSRANKKNRLVMWHFPCRVHSHNG